MAERHAATFAFLSVGLFLIFARHAAASSRTLTFQLDQFIHLGAAWNGQFDKLARPTSTYGLPPVQVQIKPGGVGPVIGGYGFGARITLLGYFLRLDAGWPMGGFFNGKPYFYFAMGLDF